MKPRKKDDHGKGLARWGWIKSYLGPALKYAGITSADFDKIISGGDQHIEQGQSSSNGSSIPNIGISINGVSYAILGDIPPGDGYISVIFEFTPEVTEIDASSSPESFIFSGNITVTALPTWILGNDFNIRASVFPDGSIDSPGRVIIPIAYREGSNIEVLIRSNIIFETVGTLGIDGVLT
jgi:hypothetical protein